MPFQGQLSVHADGLPIVFYGANSQEEQATYVEELTGTRLQSQVTALEYKLDPAGQQVPVTGGIVFRHCFEDSLLHTLEVFVLHWTCYLFSYAQYVPDADTFAKYGVFFSKPAAYPLSDIQFWLIASQGRFQEYLDEVFCTQATHEAAVSMLRQRIMHSGDMVPAKWMAMPGHSEPFWKIQGLEVDNRTNNDSLPHFEVPINRCGHPTLNHVAPLYSFVRHCHTQFVIHNPALHFRLNTPHSKNSEKMDLYESKNVAHPMNDFPDSYFDRLTSDSIPTTPSSPFSPAPQPDATPEDMDLWKTQEPDHEERSQWTDDSSNRHCQHPACQGSDATDKIPLAEMVRRRLQRQYSDGSGSVDSISSSVAGYSIPEEERHLYDLNSPTNTDAAENPLHDAAASWGPQPQDPTVDLRTEFERALATWATGVGHADESWSVRGVYDINSPLDAPVLTPEIPDAPRQLPTPLSPLPAYDTAPLSDFSDSIEEDFFQAFVLTAALATEPDSDNALHLYGMDQDAIIYSHVDSLDTMESFVAVEIIEGQNSWEWNENGDLITLD